MSDTPKPAFDALGALRGMRIYVTSAGDFVEHAIGEAKAAGLTDFENDLRNGADSLAGLITEIDDAIAAAGLQV